MEIRNTPHFSFPQSYEIIEGKTETYEKKVGALSASYQHAIPDELADKIAYRVVSISTPDPALTGSLNFGVTYLNPFTVEGEYSFTRGHFHSDKNYDEYYFGIQGNGFLLFWDGGDEVFTEKVFPGSIHYINGKYAHRLINSDTNVILAVGACWNVLAGHDYASIDRRGFPKRCFEVDGKPVWK